jgi:uncharacterized protein (UPF0548 family)
VREGRGGRRGGDSGGRFRLGGGKGTWVEARAARSGHWQARREAGVRARLGEVATTRPRE